jgi:hypothetical protein
MEVNCLVSTEELFSFLLDCALEAEELKKDIESTWPLSFAFWGF